MAVTPEVLLDAAIVIGEGDEEVDWRNAASRAYYAAFHRCVAVAHDAGLSISNTGSVHVTLIGALVDPLSPTVLRSLGYMLEQCRMRRVDADYRISQDFPRNLAETVLADCRRILQRADEVSG